jgi:voltage-gated potassium channel
MILTPKVYRHYYLLLALLITVTLRPFLADDANGIEMLDGMVLATILIGAFCTAGGKRSLTMAVSFALIAISCKIALYMTESTTLIIVFLTTLALTYLTISAHMLRSLLTSKSVVTVDTICGAIAIYMMIGLAWAMLYSLLELIVPGSFQVNSDEQIDPLRFGRFIGFSFITITTLGYGNVAPAGAQADAITTLEALIGQFYMAVIVARLVGMQLTNHLTQQGSHPSPPQS